MIHFCWSDESNWKPTNYKTTIEAQAEWNKSLANWIKEHGKPPTKATPIFRRHYGLTGVIRTMSLPKETWWNGTCFISRFLNSYNYRGFHEEWFDRRFEFPQSYDAMKQQEAE